MSDQSFDIPSVPERDQEGGDDLPTYDDLTEQNGPNSRFGRWRGWIEKRAAERYADLSPDALKARRAKGWGAGVENAEDASLRPVSSSSAHGAALQLHLQTNFSTTSIERTQSAATVQSVNLTPQPSIGEPLFPSHLQVHQFGSRFLPHTTSAIRCLLPLLGDRLLLIGHDDGLSVMDMFPKEWNDAGLACKGPGDAEARPIWVGEGVFQMNILESESNGEGTPQGVVLALVGPDSPREQEGVRTLRMYNLASLVSLAKYSVVQRPGSRPLDLRHPTSGKPTQTTPRRHRKGPSLAKGLKNLMTESPPPSGSTNAIYQVRSEAYVQLPSAVEISNNSSVVFNTSPVNDPTTSLDSTWDMVDDLPLRWATDYVPLAGTGSRLTNTSVLAYALYRDENQRSRGGAFLAVAVKSNIFLYETPKGERAFRFEFYTPITARNLTFVHQGVLDPMSRSPSDISHVRNNLASPSARHPKRLSMGGHIPSHPQYPPQLSIFVVFEKKAGLIRIADSAVGEVELYDEASSSGPQHNLLLSPGSLSKKSRSSWDSRSFLKESKASWLLPVRIVVPGQSNEGWTSPSQSMYLVTRGRHSHILPYPLPANLPSIPPFRTFTWTSSPNHISARICRAAQMTSALDGSSSSTFLQVTAFGEEGVEVQEIPLSALTVNTGKGKHRATEEPVRASMDIGGDTGFLCVGGHWDDDPARPHFMRSDSTMSNDSVLEDISSSRTPTRLREREGVYGWVRKGAEDWRVFWVGGTGDPVDPS
ncbi:hypothetical protein EIP91_005363 [Steccherinum ochraceum]|uniref:Uncharacterized protein n=1 Tax=Steccherinum ochraceum TaxID=92696 RepID=A0A4R0R7A0_9APHY|nr:hypothetical protein EIP91_005363 [Steccherinum ochraceum]